MTDCLVDRWNKVVQCWEVRRVGLLTSCVRGDVELEISQSDQSLLAHAVNQPRPALREECSYYPTWIQRLARSVWQDYSRSCK